MLVGGKRDAPGNAPASLFKLVVLLLFSCNFPTLLLLVLVVLLLFEQWVGDLAIEEVYNEVKEPLLGAEVMVHVAQVISVEI